MFRKLELMYLWSLLFVVSLFACSNAAKDASRNIPPLPVVKALYANASNWNDYVRNGDTATVCDGSETGGYDTCIHSGERRIVPVPGYRSCADLGATDALAAFDWICNPSSDPVRMVSTGLKEGKYLSDLIDFNTLGWKPNTVTVTGTTAAPLPLPFTTASAEWWSNSFLAANSGGSLAAAGTIYLVTANPNATITVDASKVAVVIQPGVTLTGSTTSDEDIISAASKNFLWLEGAIDGSGDSINIKWDNVKFSVIRNAQASDTGSTGLQRVGVYLTGCSNNSLSGITTANNINGIELVSSPYNILSEITAINNNLFGILLDSSSNNSLLNLSAINNNIGIKLDRASNNSLSNIAAAVNSGIGVFLINSNYNNLSNITAVYDTNGVVLDFSQNNMLSEITAANSVFLGVKIERSSNNGLSNITTFNNGGTGVVLFSASNNNLSNITTANNQVQGIILDTSSSNTLANIIAVNNGFYGLHFLGSSGNTLSNIAAVHNGNGVDSGTGIGLESWVDSGTSTVLATSNNNYFTGLLKVGDNTNNDCFDNQGDSFVNNNCQAASLSNFNLTPGVTLATSFVAKIGATGLVDITEDSANPDDDNTPGTSVFTNVTDWISFENNYRAWGLDGTAFPNGDHQGQWTMTEEQPVDITGRIWDWSLANGDTTGEAGAPVIQKVVFVPTGSDAIKHKWDVNICSISGYTNQKECIAPAVGGTWGTPTQAVCDDIPDAVWNAGECTTTFLRNASEMIGDGIGNDNVLCETGEACLYTSNIGSYQGHGVLQLQSAGGFSAGDGSITGVTLLEYSINGYE